MPFLHRSRFVISTGQPRIVIRGAERRRIVELSVKRKKEYDQTREAVEDVGHYNNALCESNRSNVNCIVCRRLWGIFKCIYLYSRFFSQNSKLRKPLFQSCFGVVPEGAEGQAHFLGAISHHTEGGLNGDGIHLGEKLVNKGEKL